MPDSEKTTASPRSQVEQPVSLVIPCKAEYLSLCRLVAGVVGAREALDEESIADLKLVVTEACSCFVWGPDGRLSLDEPEPAEQPTFLRVDFNVKHDEWEITISDPERRRRVLLGRCDPYSEEGLGLTIIKALVDRMEQYEDEAQGSVIKLVKRLPSRRVPKL